MQEEQASPTPSTALPPLRVYRDWAWVRVPGVELRLGGPPAPMQLEERDTLQMQVNGQWVPVPVVEAPKPEHPGAAAERKRRAEESKRMQESVAQFLPQLRQLAQQAKADTKA
jgi:hypothetical protein